MTNAPRRAFNAISYFTLFSISLLADKDIAQALFSFLIIFRRIYLYAGDAKCCFKSVNTRHVVPFRIRSSLDRDYFLSAIECYSIFRLKMSPAFSAFRFGLPVRRDCRSQLGIDAFISLRKFNIEMPLRRFFISGPIYGRISQRIF